MSQRESQECCTDDIKLFLVFQSALQTWKKSHFTLISTAGFHISGRQRNAACSLYSPVSFWPPHTLPFTFYGLHAEPNLESSGNVSSIWSWFMSAFACKFPRFAVKVLMSRTTCEIQDYCREINDCFDAKLCKTKEPIFCLSAKNNFWQGCRKIRSWFIQFALNTMRYHNAIFCNAHKRCTVAHRQQQEPSPCPSWKLSSPPTACTAASTTGILETKLQCIILLKGFDRNYMTERPSQ